MSVIMLLTGLQQDFCMRVVRPCAPCGDILVSPIHHLFGLRHFIDRAMLQQRPSFLSCVDLQKAYDTVQHGLLWARLEGIGVGPKMLAAIKSLYASGTLSMKVGGTAGPSLVQQMGCGRAALSALPCSTSSLMACMAIWIAACRMLGCSWALADGCQLSCTPTMLSCRPGQLLGYRTFWTACMPSA